MLPSSSSPSSRKGDRRSRSTTPAASLADEQPQLSDVQCYTCRRRHVKCDRILPTCAKCRKKGVPCLGYQKPLRWADGVAVRGKLKGKSQPVVDNKVMNMVRKNSQVQADTALKEASSYGLQSVDTGFNNVVADESQALELLEYHNSVICTERVVASPTSPVDRHIAQISHEVAQRLPRTIVDCVLGIAAVHMASRKPGDKMLERLALETKVKVFQSHNRLLQTPHLQVSPDVVIATGILIFAMDLFEHGMSRWVIHTLGCMQVMASFGGIERLSYFYPHLHVSFFHVAHLETVWIALSHNTLTRPKQVSRAALEMLCHAPLVKPRIFNPCPTPLTLAIWDIGDCAQKIFGDARHLSFADMHRREQILLDILAFQPEDGTKAIMEDYFKNAPQANVDINSFSAVCAVWKAAVTILALRYLYLGRPQLMPQSYLQRSPTPSMATPTSTFATHNQFGAYYTEDFTMSNIVDDSSDVENVPEFLTPGMYVDDTLSRSPSPLPSPLQYNEPPTSQLWDQRYELHDDAFAVLATTFNAIRNNHETAVLRYVMVPLFIFALISRKGSEERALSEYLGTAFKEHMSASSAGPVGGDELECNIPWDKLDAFSETVEREQRGSAFSTGAQMAKTAPEWNWWDMLKHTDLDMAWPVTVGMSHYESGSEFWGFVLLSSVVNEECFNIWLQEPAPSQSSASSA